MRGMNLPGHWKTARLGEVTDIFKGGTPKRSVEKYFEGDIPWAIPTDVTALGSALYIDDTNTHISEEALGRSAARLLPVGTVLLTSRATIGETAIPTVPMATNQGFANFICKDMLLNIYLAYYLRYVKKRLIDLAHGSTFKEITKGTLLNVEIPLPSLPEQRAIAHVLQAIQEAKSTRQRELALERERKAALMDYLFSYGTKGELRKETEIGEIPESWEVVKLDELRDLIQYGTSRRCNTDKGGVPVLRIPNIVGGKVDIADLKFMEPSEREFQSLLLEVGDLLFVRTNGRKEYTGRCAVFQGEFQESLFASYLIRVRLKSDTALPEFVQLYTMTPRGRSYLSGRASNAADGKFNINTQTIKSVLLPLPDSLEQCEIVETCRAFDIKIAALEQEAERLDELFHAMLDELMTGQRSAVPLIDTESSN